MFCLHAVGKAVAQVPSYDVVTIKPNTSMSGSVHVSSYDDRISATNVSLKNLLQYAYDIREDLISGVPGPIAGARFDLEAKIVDPDPKKKLKGTERGAMMRPVLEDRFALKVHTEVKELPVYELVLMSGGPKFKPAADLTGKDDHTNVDGSKDGTALNATGVTMASLVATLAGQVHRVVLDKTGLAGQFDIAMKWVPDDSAPGTQSDLPSIFTALQEQLGLKLVATKGPVNTLVVDHVAMPTPN